MPETVLSIILIIFHIVVIAVMYVTEYYYLSFEDEERNHYNHRVYIWGSQGLYPLLIPEGMHFICNC